MDEPFYDKEKQNFLKNDGSKEKCKEEKETLSSKKLQLLQTGGKIDKQGDKHMENSKIRKNQIEKIEGKDCKNHIFETDFPDEENMNKDIRYNHDLINKNDINQIKPPNLNHDNMNNQYEYSNIDNAGNMINKLARNTDLIKRNQLTYNNRINEKNSDTNNIHSNNAKFNLNVCLNAKSNFGFKNNQTDKPHFDEYDKKVVKRNESYNDKNKKEELHLNIYPKKQMSLTNIYKGKEEEEDGKFSNRVRKLSN